MARRLIRSRIGYARLPSNVDPSQAGYTQAIRAQMKSIEDNLTEVISQVKDAGPDIVLDALQPTFDKSQSYVPVKSGVLKDSGYLGAKEVNGETIAEIGYGKSGQPPYAVFVHERLDLQHAAPTRAKFLQSALEEDMSDIQARLFAGYAALLG